MTTTTKPLVQKLGFYLAFSAIVGYWLYDCFFKSAPEVLPTDFLDIFSRVMINKSVMLCIIMLLLQLEGYSLSDSAYFGSKQSKTWLWGSLLGLAIWILLNMISNPILSSLLPKTSEKGTDMVIYMHGLRNFLLWMPMVIFASFIEEIQRVYMLQRFETWFGTVGLFVALAMTTLTFGMGHLYQGLAAAIGTGLGGLCYALVYLRRRSLLEACLCHAIFDVVAVSIGYLIAK